LKAYDAILQLDARNVVAWMNKGLIFFELKQYENALQAYQKATFLDPTNAMAFYNMAAILERLNKHSEKSQALDHATQLGYSGHFNLASSASMMETEPPTPRLLPWPIATLKSGVPGAATCSLGHTNLFGSVWCEICEELLVARLGDTDEKEVEKTPQPRTGGIQRRTRDRW
jgi:tetratricopeptide (TPR) repeat protein